MEENNKKNVCEYNMRSEKESTKLHRLYYRWYNLLFLKVLTMFEWKGLPFPQRELEKKLITRGGASIVDDVKAGIICPYGSAFGVTVYDDVFTHVTYSAPKANGGTLEIGDKAIFIYANSLMFPLIGVVEKYASLLAHYDITLKCVLVNYRYSDIMVANDSNTKDDIQAWYRDMYNGELASILSHNLLGESSVYNVASSKNYSSSIYSDILNGQNELLRSFYREIGVRWSKEKKGNMIEDEVNNDTQMLLFNISDMLKCRKKACEEYKKVFGTEISVDVSEEFKMLEGEYNYDGDN